MITTPQAAQLLGISRMGVTTAIRRGLMKASMYDGHYAISETEVARYKRTICHPRPPKKADRKSCSTCGSEKPLHEFTEDRRKPDGFGSRCRDCEAIRSSHRSEERKEKRRIAKLYPLAAVSSPCPTKKALKHMGKTSPGYVYLIKTHRRFKIGLARDVDKRLSAIRTSVPYRIELVCAISTEYTYILERQLHERFFDKRVQGEWFDLTDADVEDIKRLAA